MVTANFGNLLQKLRQLGDVRRDPSRTPKSHFRDGRHSARGRSRAVSHYEFWGTDMKTLLVGIIFIIAIFSTSQAFATDLPDCPNVKWKHGRYVCGDVQANS